ncbi:MAG TPA: PIG-L deacetylase family protein [Egicoccus sp.]|nr:PIG-L deacetylase family protein [Egicoccus sp.]HSK21605.1 PIG-L deacetylase family protein [Egicoccus sp.]
MSKLVRVLLQARQSIERLVLSRRAYKFVVRDWVALGDLEAAARVIGTMRYSANLEPLELEGPRARRVLVIAPHPDDEMIGPGGTVIRLVQRGVAVRVVYLTLDAGEPGATRKRETMAVAREVGYETTFLDLPAGSLRADDATVALVAEQIRSFQPGTVFVPFVLDDHPEHRMSSRVLARTVDAGVDGDIEVWAYQVYTSLIPNVVVDVTEEHARKAAVIRMWRDSAMRSRDWAHYALGLNAYNSRWLRKPPGEYYVETFFVLPLHEYAEVCARLPDS